MRHFLSAIGANGSNLMNKFITLNAYMCIELNAHYSYSNNSKQVKQAQLCLSTMGRLFRAARSMTSIFSTVINFGMLGLVRRVHRLQIQSH